MDNSPLAPLGHLMAMKKPKRARTSEVDREVVSAIKELGITALMPSASDINLGTYDELAEWRKLGTDSPDGMRALLEGGVARIRELEKIVREERDKYFHLVSGQYEKLDDAKFMGRSFRDIRSDMYTLAAALRLMERVKHPRHEDGVRDCAEPCTWCEIQKFVEHRRAEINRRNQRERETKA